MWIEGGPAGFGEGRGGKGLLIGLYFGKFRGLPRRATMLFGIFRESM